MHRQKDESLSDDIGVAVAAASRHDDARGPLLEAPGKPTHFSVVIPVFNEQERIERTIRVIAEYLQPRCGSGYEIIVADDGSRDATSEVVTKLQQQVPPLRLLRVEQNVGKGNAVRRGVAASTGALVLMTDADLATPIEEIETLEARIQGGADIVVASRGLKRSQIVVHQPFPRELMGKLFNLLVQLVLLPGIHDTQCGFKLFRGQVARRLFAHSMVGGFAFDVEVLGLAASASYEIVEVPVRWSHMKYSKINPGRDGLAMFLDTVKIAYRLRTGAYDLAALTAER